MYATTHAANPIGHSGRIPRTQSSAAGLTKTEAIIATCALVLALCAAFIPAVSSHAATTATTAPTISVKVASQDTLWDIAKAHPIKGQTTAETVRVIKSLNDMSGSMISAGEVIRVPAPATALTAVARR
jgi:LysM repeat protein